jgi:glycosyl hydrolase family 101 (putative endo-alpha-N-acetylgalactosaminidase)
MTEESADYYDWTTTMAPERPWRHDYSQTLVMKIVLGTCYGAERTKEVHATFESALDIICRLDTLTLGVPKIVYLVGWQFSGHDSGYPSWATVNEDLKRSEDAEAAESLRWLIRAARTFNTTVSLHINMIDAYRDSPLWAEYEAADVVLKDLAGRPIPGETFDGMTSYQLSYAREWELGLAQRRIDDLLELLPELREGGTIHIDAFHSIQPVRPDDEESSPYLGLTIGDEIRAQRRIFRYWRTQGLDVTAEGAKYALRRDPFIGLQPMAWHFIGQNFLDEPWPERPALSYFNGFPASLYCGTPMQAEREIKVDPKNLDGLLGQFCTAVLPWYYDNNPAPKADEGLWSRGQDIFLPALWQPDTVVAYSTHGYGTRAWRLPDSWAGRPVSVSRLAVVPTPVYEGPINGTDLKLGLSAGEAAVIKARPGNRGLERQVTQEAARPSVGRNADRQRIFRAPLRNGIVRDYESRYGRGRRTRRRERRHGEPRRQRPAGCFR